jgi:hypothetical protein
VAEASIDHANDRQVHQTDKEGRFVLDTRAPALVIRKTGFRSELVRTKDATGVRVTLQKLSETRVFPKCSSNGRYVGIEGWQASFQFPEISGIKASKQIRDSDYGARNYYTDARNGIRHGSGPMWSTGVPLDHDVWRSVKYEEVTFDVGGQTIIDARGELPDGTRWRSLGRLGESASYSDADETSAASLDRFLDGACLKSTVRR